MRNISEHDVFDLILYSILKEAKTDKLTSEHYYIQRAIYQLTRKVPELKKFFPFRAARKYSEKLDNALFFANLSQILERPSNPMLRYYQIDSKKIERIGKNIENKLPKELIEAVTEGIKRIKDTDEFRHLVEL